MEKIKTMKEPEEEISGRLRTLIAVFSIIVPILLNIILNHIKK